MGDRVHKSLLNARVNVVFYFLSLFLAFFSRKTFLDCLGAEFIGLTGTLESILGYLNIAELGIGSCISYFLYKPLQTGNRSETCEIVSVIGYLYRWIGLVVLGGGVGVSLFFPLIFGSTDIGLGIVYFAFFSFLGSSLIGYFINYRQVLLSADQKNYLVAIYFQSANLVKLALQIWLDLRTGNVYVWVAVEFVFGVIGCVVLNWKIDREYPWLTTDKRKGRELLRKYPGILTRTRQIFIHKIKDFMLGKSDELFIFAFVSLTMVSFYGNYMLIIRKATQLFNTVLESANAGIGNLVAEGDRKKMLGVFWELTALRHFVAGMLCFSIYHFLEPFIVLWLGSDYVLDHGILVLLVVLVYIGNSRGVVDAFNHAHGLYADVWAAWVELIVNVGITIVCGLHWGIAGILLGKIVSLMLIVALWKPYYLFHSGFRLSVSQYWSGTLRCYAIFALAFAGGSAAARSLPIAPGASYLNWVVYCAVSLAVWAVIEVPLMLLFAKGARQLAGRMWKGKGKSEK